MLFRRAIFWQMPQTMAAIRTYYVRTADAELYLAEIANLKLRISRHMEANSRLDRGLSAELNSIRSQSWIIWTQKNGRIMRKDQDLGV